MISCLIIEKCCLMKIYKRLINESEYIKVKKKLMEDYGVVSDITTLKI